MQKIVRFKKINDARTFNMLLKSAKIEYTFRRYKRNDRFGTTIFEFIIQINSQKY